MLGRVSGKVAIITGAASGLGEATARLMHAESMAVILNTTSIGGLQRGLGPHIYGAAKGAVVARCVWYGGFPARAER